MADHVTDEAVETVTGTVDRAGGTRRRELRLPADAADEFPSDEVVRVVLDGSTYHTEIARRTDGAPAIRGAYDTPSLARDPGDGTDRLTAWLEDAGLEDGRSVHVDVVEPGFKYGVRAPGESATYEAVEPANSSLADIAESLGEQQ